MAKRTTYRLGPDVPETETLRDRKGRVVDDRYVSEAVEDAVRKARRRARAPATRRGGPVSGSCMAVHALPTADVSPGRGAHAPISVLQ